MEVRRHIARAASGSVIETRPGYRTAIGVLGVALPLWLIFGGMLRGVDVQPSISAYYHQPKMRDWFVGILWVIGVFLFFYQYHPPDETRAPSKVRAIRIGKADAWLGKLAGLGAVFVAMFPTNPPPLSPAQAPVIGWIHGGAAAMLFLCLSLFPLLLFSQSPTKAGRYLKIGWAMLLILAATALNQLLFSDLRLTVLGFELLLIFETALILLFGAGWFLKGLELRKKEQEEPRRRPAA